MRYLLTVAIVFLATVSNAQELRPIIKGDSIIYNLTVSELKVNYSGKDR